MSTTYDDLISFHGHNCPGLAIGYRMTKAAMDFLVSSPATDKKLVAIVESISCGVDALQYLSGCTFGKRNLIFKDYGKQVYTLYDRDTKKSARVVFNARNMPKDIAQDREQLIKWLLTAPDDDILSLREVHIDEPEQARIMETVVCESCGESVMATRVKKLNDITVCIPCFEKDKAI